MNEQDPVSPEILERLAKLEAQVGWLTQQVQGNAPREASRSTAPLPTMPPPRPVPPRPPPPRLAPKAPRQPINPIIWVATAGSAIFLIGAAFFLHWSIQRGWIGPELRFLLGLVVGGGLSVGAARLMLGDSAKLGVAVLLAGSRHPDLHLPLGGLRIPLLPAGAGFRGHVPLHPDGRGAQRPGPNPAGPCPSRSSRGCSRRWSSVRAVITNSPWPSTSQC